MMKEYKKIIIMAAVLLIMIVAIVVALTTDVDFGLFKNLSIASISHKKVSVETLAQNEVVEKIEHEQAIDVLESAKNKYETSRQKFENIDKSTIDMVQEATKDEKYFIEYLWIVLGSYANDNGLLINIITPGSTAGIDEQETQDGDKGESTESKPTLDVSVAGDAIKIIVRGRYANVADFVYEVENDKELKFKLDNIKMTYASNNEIEATFNVLSLKVKK